MSTPQTPAHPDQLRAEIAETRAGLGDTVEALAAKTDVKNRARQAFDGTKSRVRLNLITAKAQISEKSKDPRVRRAVATTTIAALAATILGAAAVVTRQRRAPRTVWQRLRR
ncbi:DUF3618 domain-containing protein [Actinoplanes regularis]|uniref:DUF3618 domain-containing protein n=1 Tax=Actinoplanes regularis TaxID=52697 RepID=UPI0024A299DC|nr:DUF3618 domain-containing protein [Actinoplanes regularis]GLW34260.1 hypothetical protein Areg01_71970 [Actinoplanes regularis]